MQHRCTIVVTTSHMHSPQSEGMFAGYSRLLDWTDIT